MTVKRQQVNQFVTSYCINKPVNGMVRNRDIAKLWVGSTVKSLPVFATEKDFIAIDLSTSTIYTLQSDLDKHYIWSPAREYRSITVAGSEFRVISTAETEMQIASKAGPVTTDVDFYIDPIYTDDPYHWVSNSFASRSLSATDPLARANDWERSLCYAEKQTGVKVLGPTSAFTIKTTSFGFLQSLASFSTVSLNSVIDITDIATPGLFDASLKPVGIEQMPELEYRNYGVSAEYTRAVYRYYVIPIIDGDYQTIVATTPVQYQILKYVRPTGRGGLYYKSISVTELAMTYGLYANLVCQLGANRSADTLTSVPSYQMAMQCFIESDEKVAASWTNWATNGMAVSGMVLGIVANSLILIGLIIWGAWLMMKWIGVNI